MAAYSPILSQLDVARQLAGREEVARWPAFLVGQLPGSRSCVFRAVLCVVFALVSHLGHVCPFPDVQFTHSFTIMLSTI